MDIESAGLTLGSQVIVSIDETQRFRGTYEGFVRVKDVLQNKASMDFQTLGKEAPTGNTMVDSHREMIIEGGLETERFRLEDGKIVYGFQCSKWESGETIH